ncbi:MAG TPA: hypothetical protein VH209_14205 [Steroidobacteraceae bacterium]|jgi:hypothetical protein|nr:hypothetical protein [Steroidobacteraceae bacterium]
MLTKREFVKQAAAVVTVAIAVPAVSAEAAVSLVAQAPFDVVVYNDWHPRAQAFSADLSARGVPTFAVKGDAGKLWYDTLRGLVGKRSCRIAGMTTHTDLLILETLARDQGLRVRRRSTLNGSRLVSWVLI